MEERDEYLQIHIIMKNKSTSPWEMCFSKMINEFQRTTLSFLELIQLFKKAYFDLSQHYLFSGIQSQKKVKEEDWLIVVILGRSDT